MNAGSSSAPEKKVLPVALQAYLVAHVALLPLLIWGLANAPAPTSLTQSAILLLAATIASTWRMTLPTPSVKQSLVFAIVCCAFLLEGERVAVTCAALGALITHLVKPLGPGRPWWQLKYHRIPLHQRLFNPVHCALVCGISAGLARGVQPSVPDNWVGSLCVLGVFATVYFLLNTFGVATAVALDQGKSPWQSWRTNYFWTAPGYMLSALAAYTIWIAKLKAGPVALVLLVAVYGVYLAYRSYVENLVRHEQMTDEIARLYEELKASDRRKDEFLAMLGHELRNPLAAIMNAQYLMEARLPNDDNLRKHHQVIERQAHHLGRLVDDLLEISRITRGKVELRQELCDLREVLEGTLRAVAPVIQGRSHEIRVHIPAEPLPVNADPVRVEQIFCNLIANAAKYTEPGGRIDVEVEALHSSDDDPREWVEVRVRDNGMGIDPELLPRIFEVFVQADRSLDRSQGGLGLGLTLVKRLVEMHEGTVEARSAGAGLGSEFIVRLPLSAESLPVPAPRVAATPAPPARRESEDAGRPLRVLVVDDVRDAADSLADLLLMWDLQVSVAYDGVSALEAAAKSVPDVVLLDIGLPGMDGYEVARRLRAHPALDGVQLIAVTGYGQEEDRQRAFAAGFNQHVTKPADPEQIRQVLLRCAGAPHESYGSGG